MNRSQPISACVLALVLGSSSVAAQTAPLTSASPDEALSDTARDLFAKGVKASQQQKWDQCRAAFLAAWGIKKVAQIAGNLALCEVKLGLHRDAAEHIAFFLDAQKADTPPERRSAAEAVLREASAKIATVRLRVNVDGAEVLVDGHSLGNAPVKAPVFFDPGPHAIEARQEGYPTARVAFDAQAGASEVVALDLVAPPPKQPDPVPPPRPRWPMIVTGVLAAGGLAAGAGLAVAANGKSSDAATLRAGLGGGRSQCFAAVGGECQALSSALTSQGTLANGALGSFVAGGAFALATAGLGAWAFTKPAAPTKGEVRIVPVLGAAEQGVRIVGSW